MNLVVSALKVVGNGLQPVVLKVELLEGVKGFGMLFVCGLEALGDGGQLVQAGQQVLDPQAFRRPEFHGAVDQAVDWFGLVADQRRTQVRQRLVVGCRLDLVGERARDLQHFTQPPAQVFQPGQIHGEQRPGVFGGGAVARGPVGELLCDSLRVASHLLQVIELGAGVFGQLVESGLELCCGHRGMSRLGFREGGLLLPLALPGLDLHIEMALGCFRLAVACRVVGHLCGDGRGLGRGIALVGVSDLSEQVPLAAGVLQPLLQAAGPGEHVSQPFDRAFVQAGQG